MKFLEDFDSVIVGTYEGESNFYYKIADLDMDSRKNTMYSRVTKIDDNFAKYILFGQADKDFNSYKELDLEESEHDLCSYISFLGTWPGPILNKKEGQRDDLEIPEAVFVIDGRIFIGKRLLRIPEFMIHFPMIVRNVGEIFRKGFISYS